MKASTVRFLFEPIFEPIRKSLLGVAVLLVSNFVQPAMAQTHSFPSLGKSVMIEAERYSNASPTWPHSQTCASCSGGANLGFYENGHWFEISVVVPQMLRYSISLKSASPVGTSIKVEMVDATGVTLLTTIGVPATGSWDTFSQTLSSSVSLPAGVRTLRFTNPGAGANIDFISVTAASTPAVTFSPPLGLGPDINPLKGFGSSWWRGQDIAEPWASIGFQYIEWGKFEPTDDVFNWDYVEEVINRPGSKDRHIILQFVVDWDNYDDMTPAPDQYKGPAWLPTNIINRHTGPAVVDPSKPNRISRATDYNDPLFIAEALEAIDALQNGRNGHPGLKNDPRTFVLQIGVLGYYGEWHTYPRTDWAPTDATKKAIFDAHIRNLGSSGVTQIRYPTEAIAVPQRGLGYTNGSATPTPHGYEFGVAIEAGGLWKNGPVGGEWPPGVENQYWRRFFKSREGMQFLQQGHYSTMTPPQPSELANVFPGWTPDPYFMTLHRFMGYTFQAKSVSHIVATDASGLTYVEVELANIGIAPFYKDWQVQLAILEASTGKVVGLTKTATDIRTLASKGTIKISDSIRATLDKKGAYKIGLRIVQTGADDVKIEKWKLNARNTYIGLANDIELTPALWDSSNALQGGWNMVGNVQF